MTNTHKENHMYDTKTKPLSPEAIRLGKYVEWRSSVTGARYRGCVTAFDMFIGEVKLDSLWLTTRPGEGDVYEVTA